MADREAREAAVASTEEACPRCGTPREPDQEYCLECGLRLPVLTGPVAAFRRSWIRRFGWYPGDWVWTSLLALLVAAAGAGAAIALSGGTSGGGRTFVVSTSPVASTTTRPTTTRALPVPPEPTTTRRTTTTRTTTAKATTTTTTTVPRTTTTTTTPAKTTTTTPTPAPTGLTPWPNRSGWTDVLVSYPSRGGRATPLSVARRAIRSGLPQVGVLDSAGFRSLHGGYYVVFSGVYGSQAAAQAALTRVRAGGFSGAYPRQISR